MRASINTFMKELEEEFMDMYQLYKYILKNNVNVESSKKYGPDELVARIFYYTLTGGIAFVPRPLRDVVERTKEKDNETLGEWTSKRIHRKEGIANTYFFQPYEDIRTPKEGYKLHIPAPPDKVKEFAEFFSAIFEHYNIRFKVVRSEERYEKLNKNFWQAGKFITVYPKGSGESYIRNIADYLKGLLGSEYVKSIIEKAPKVKEEKYADGVYYRYYKSGLDDNRNDPLQGHLPLESYSKRLPK